MNYGVLGLVQARRQAVLLASAAVLLMAAIAAVVFPYFGTAVGPSGAAARWSLLAFGALCAIVTIVLELRGGLRG